MGNDKLSLPSRGAWIETLSSVYRSATLERRSPHGERGLKHCGSLRQGKADIVAPLTGSVD